MRGLKRKLVAGVLVVASIGSDAAEVPGVFDAEVQDVRPRIFLRNEEDFEGLTIEKLRKRSRSGELERAGALSKWRARPLGRALLWMLDGKSSDLEAALEGLRGMEASGGTWSDRGLQLIRLAALFDWLYPELEPGARAEAVSRIERAADAAVEHVRQGQAPFFYSRTPGAIAGLAVAGLALHGVSPKAEAYLETFREFGPGELFKAYDWVDGAATGATYTLYYTFVDLPAICAAWWSATGKNPAPWIGEHQGAWLDDIVRFYLWYFRPGFAFTHINDQSRGDWQTHDQFCQGLDLATYVTRRGEGRAWSERWLARFGSALYHTEYAHNLIFRDPSVPSVDLSDLPRAELFGRESCGYGFFRSEWPAQGEPDVATHVFFRCGDPVNVHGGVAAGEFQVFRHAPLADRGGRYSSYDSPPDQYHRNCISANVVLFLDPAVPGDRGDQNTRRGLKSDHRTWEEWLEIRRRSGLDVATITEWDVSEGRARCRADLTRTNPESKCSRWERELLWLADKHLLVLDVVETSRPEIQRLWQLHCGSAPELGDRCVTVTNRTPTVQWADGALAPPVSEGRLFVQTLLPRSYAAVVHTDAKAWEVDRTGASRRAVEGNPYHLQHGRHVVQIDPGADSTRTIFLHVLTAVDASSGVAPACSLRRVSPGVLEVSVDGASATLRVPPWLE